MPIHELQAGAQQVGIGVPTGMYWHLFVSDAHVLETHNRTVISFDLQPSFAAARDTNVYMDAVALERQAVDIESIELSDEQTLTLLRRRLTANPDHTRELELFFSGKNSLQYAIENINDADVMHLSVRYIATRV